MLSKIEDDEIKLANLNNQSNDQSKILENQQESESIQAFLSNNDNFSKNLSVVEKIEISADDASKSKIKQKNSIRLKRWLETVFCCSNCCLAYSKFQVYIIKILLLKKFANCIFILSI